MTNFTYATILNVEIEVIETATGKTTQRLVNPNKDAQVLDLMARAETVVRQTAAGEVTNTDNGLRASRKFGAYTVYVYAK